MFDKDSRYAKLPIKETVDAAGRPLAYVSRRIIPADPRHVAEIRVQPGDRLDLVSHRAYGDPRLFWRVADANPDPDHGDLAREPGRRLKITQIEPR